MVYSCLPKIKHLEHFSFHKKTGLKFHMPNRMVHSGGIDPTHGFGSKMTIFAKFFLRQYRPGKFLLRYSRTKKNPFKAKKKQEVEKVEKLTFFQRV